MDNRRHMKEKHFFLENFKNKHMCFMMKLRSATVKKDTYRNPTRNLELSRNLILSPRRPSTVFCKVC